MDFNLNEARIRQLFLIEVKFKTLNQHGDKLFPHNILIYKKILFCGNYFKKGISTKAFEFLFIAPAYPGTILLMQLPPE